MLSESENADFEITIETDFGRLIAGSKDGIPFDILTEE